MPEWLALQYPTLLRRVYIRKHERPVHKPKICEMLFQLFRGKYSQWRIILLSISITNWKHGLQGYGKTGVYFTNDAKISHCKQDAVQTITNPELFCHIVSKDFFFFFQAGFSYTTYPGNITSRAGKHLTISYGRLHTLRAGKK